MSAPSTARLRVGTTAAPTTTARFESSTPSASGDATVVSLQPALSESDIRELFLSHQASIVGLFRRKGADAEEARDLSQDTFLRAFRARRGFLGQAQGKTWLYTIARNVWNNHIRDSKAQKRDGQELPLESSKADDGPIGELPEASMAGAREPSPENRFLADERIRRLQVAVKELPPQMRRCFLLRFQDGLKYREIAALLDISVDTVKPHLFNARKRLRKSLSPPPPRNEGILWKSWQVKGLREAQQLFVVGAKTADRVLSRCFGLFVYRFSRLY